MVGLSVWCLAPFDDHTFQNRSLRLDVTEALA